MSDFTKTLLQLLVIQWSITEVNVHNISLGGSHAGCSSLLNATFSLSLTTSTDDCSAFRQTTDEPALSSTHTLKSSIDSSVSSARKHRLSRTGKKSSLV